MPLKSNLFDELSALDSGIGDFDWELIREPNHTKRFRHLTMMVQGLEPDFLSEQIDFQFSASSRDLFAFTMAVLLSAYLTSKYFSATQTVLSLAPAKMIVVLKQINEISTDKTSTETAPTTTQLQQQQQEQEKEFPDQLAEPSLTPQEDIAPAEENPNAVHLSSQIETIVRQQLENQTREQTPRREGLSAPGFIFDPVLEEKLHSPEIANLNRWRAPDEAVLSSGNGRTLSKIGNLCVITSVAAPGGPIVELPLIGNGWNLNYYKEVDCDQYFKGWQLNREDVIATEK